jgi:hypothetical protein
MESSNVSTDNTIQLEKHRMTTAFKLTVKFLINVTISWQQLWSLRVPPWLADILVPPATPPQIPQA